MISGYTFPGIRGSMCQFPKTWFAMVRGFIAVWQSPSELTNDFDFPVLPLRNGGDSGEMVANHFNLPCPLLAVK